MGKWHIVRVVAPALAVTVVGTLLVLGQLAGLPPEVVDALRSAVLDALRQSGSF